MRSTFLYTFLSFITFFTLMSFSDKEHFTSIKMNIVLQDTMSDSIEVIDTIATYDPNDYSEKIVILKRKVPRKPNLAPEKIDYENMEFSGKMTIMRDTFTTYNPTTKEETLMITSYEMPDELIEPLKTMLAKDANKLKLKFAKNKKTETQTRKKKK